MTPPRVGSAASPGGPFGQRILGRPVYADLYLDETRSRVAGQSASILKTVADLLEAHSAWSLHVGMHCDERATSAYSFAIAETRGRVVEQYLLDLGVAREQIAMESYGKEKLFCRDPAGTCWEDNRRLQATFELLAIGRSRYGCLARLRVVDGQGVDLRPVRQEARPLLRRIYPGENRGHHDE